MHAEELAPRAVRRTGGRQAAAAGDRGVLGLQRAAGNAAVTQLVQRSLLQREDDDWQGHDDPMVGQGKAVDPGDKGAGVTGTFDLSPGVGGTPKVTGGYGDAPSVGGVDPQGGQLKTPGGDNDTQSGPTRYGNTPGGGACPPGKARDPVTGWCSGEKQSTSDELGVPPAGPAPEPGDYNVPQDDQAVA